MGRLDYWTEEKKQKAIELIFDWIYNGNSVRSILDKGDREILPTFFTFNQWLSDDEELAKQYARVCECRFDLIFEEIITISDDQEGDVYIDKNGNEQVNHNVINRARLRVDSRKWALSKMNPKKYGDKIDVTTGDKPISPSTIVFKDFSNERD